MREFDAIDVVGRSAGLLGDGENLLCRDVNEFRAWIDEAPDQPGAGDAVDLRMLPGHPLGRRRSRSLAGWQASRAPSGDTTVKMRGRESSGTQGRGRGLTQLPPVHAVNNYRTICRQVSPPALDIVRGTMKRADDQSVVAGEIDGTTNVHQHTGRRRA